MFQFSVVLLYLKCIQSMQLNYSLPKELSHGLQMLFIVRTNNNGVLKIRCRKLCSSTFECLLCL